MSSFFSLRTPRQSQPCSASQPSEPPSQPPPPPRQPDDVIPEDILDVIVLMQLFMLIMNIHFSSGVDLDTLFEALEQLLEPQLIDPNIFNPTKPKIHLPRLRRQRRLKTAAKARKSRRRSACQRHGDQRVPDSAASACRQVSTSVTPAGVTRSSVVESLWTIRSAYIPFAPILSAVTLSSYAVRPPSLALGVQSGRDAAIPSEVDSFHG